MYRVLSCFKPCPYILRLENKLGIWIDLKFRRTCRILIRLIVTDFLFATIQEAAPAILVLLLVTIPATVLLGYNLSFFFKNAQLYDLETLEQVCLSPACRGSISAN